MDKRKHSYCALHKFSNASDAFRFMSGEFVLGGRGGFCVLDDDSFPAFVLSNAILYIYSYMQRIVSAKDLKETLCLDVNGEVTSGLIDEPFLLWSERLGAFYAFHYDTENVGDVTDEEFAENYKELIIAYDLDVVVQEAMFITQKNKTAIKKNKNELSRLLTQYGLQTRKIKNYGKNK